MAATDNAALVSGKLDLCWHVVGFSSPARGLLLGKFPLNITWDRAHILFNKLINSRPILNAVVQYSFSPIWDFD